MFAKPNDPAAPVNPATFAGQAQPDAVDWFIIAQAIGAAQAQGGAAVLYGCAVTPNNSGVSLNVNVAAGAVIVNGAVVIVAAQANLTVAAADATNPRFDLVTISAAGTAAVAGGAANAVACDPQPGANLCVLAEVDVPATATSITASNIVDKRVFGGASASVRAAYSKPAAALFDSMDRDACSTNIALTSGQMYMQMIILPAGITVTSITFTSASTALASGTHAWFALFDNNLGLLGQSTDDTAPAWAATTAKTYNLAAPFVTTYTGVYYLGCMVAATTPPNLVAASALAQLMSMAPVRTGTSNSGLTTTAPNPATAITVGTKPTYAYVS